MTHVSDELSTCIIYLSTPWMKVVGVEESMDILSAPTMRALEHVSDALSTLGPEQIRKLKAKRDTHCREILHLAAKAKLASRMTSSIVPAAFVTFEQEMGAVEARVRQHLCMVLEHVRSGMKWYVSRAMGTTVLLLVNSGTTRSRVVSRDDEPLDSEQES